MTGGERDWTICEGIASLMQVAEERSLKMTSSNVEREQAGDNFMINVTVYTLAFSGN